LVFDDVAVEAEVAVGDTIISSGMGGVFPEGLVVGTITGIATPTSAFFKQIKVAPAVDFSSLDNVIVMEPEE
jgi:rod shape-determining protein MreC